MLRVVGRHVHGFFHDERSHGRAGFPHREVEGSAKVLVGRGVERATVGEGGLLAGVGHGGLLAGSEKSEKGRTNEETTDSYEREEKLKRGRHRRRYSWKSCLRLLRDGSVDRDRLGARA